MKILKVVLLASLPFAAVIAPAFAPASAHDSKVTIEKPWARASIGTSRPTAAFMTIRNPSDSADRLIKVSTPVAGMAEIHQTKIKDGQAVMMKVEGVTIPARGMAMLKPGGYHIMLMRLKAPVVKGTKVPLTLTFEHGGTIKVDAMVMSPGSGGHKHHH